MGDTAHRHGRAARHPSRPSRAGTAEPDQHRTRANQPQGRHHMATRAAGQAGADVPGLGIPRTLSGWPCRIPHEAGQRRLAATGRLPRPAPVSHTTGRRGAVQGAESPYCHPRCHPSRKRGPPKRPDNLLTY